MHIIILLQFCISPYDSFSPCACGFTAYNHTTLPYIEILQVDPTTKPKGEFPKVAVKQPDFDFSFKFCAKKELYESAASAACSILCYAFGLRHRMRHSITGRVTLHKHGVKHAMHQLLLRHLSLAIYESFNHAKYGKYNNALHFQTICKLLI